jgi:hypothetical protein
MKTTILTLFAALLFVSPAFAAKPKKEAQAQQPVCRTVADAKKVVKNQQDGSAVEYELIGDELKQFNDMVNKKTGATAPDGMDMLLVFSKPGETLWVGMIFVKGCIDQIIPIKPDVFKKLLELSKGGDDGSI